MKKLFKFIFGLIGFVFFLGIIVIGLTIYGITNSKDETPLDLYEDNITINSELSEVLNTTLDTMGTKYALDVVFTEEQLNKIIYGAIKEKINTSYNPTSGTTSSEKYIKSMDIPREVKVVGGKSLAVKSAYAVIEDEILRVYVTADGLGLIKSRIAFGFKLKTLDDNYILEIVEATIGKINIFSNFGKKVFSLVTKNIDVEKQVNDSLKKSNIPFTLDFENYQLICTKEDFAKMLEGLVGSNATIKDLIDTFIMGEDVFNLGVFADNTFGVKINLEKLKVAESQLKLSSKITTNLNEDTFMQNKVQSYLISSLGSTNKKITFSEVEFSQLIYSKTEGYKNLSFTTEIIKGTNINIKVEGITVSITESSLNINVILNINGLKTIAKLTSTATQLSKDEIEIKFDDKIVFGADLSINSEFVMGFLKESLESFKILTYNEAKDSYSITADVFYGLMSKSSSLTPLKVSEIKLYNGGLNVFIEYEDITLDSLVSTITTSVQEILKDDTFVNNVAFDTTGDQAQAVITVKENIEEVASILNDATEELDEATTDKLISSINQLSIENQEALYEEIKGKIDASELEALYNQMFGK